jgi:hypothetical protein
MEGSKKINAMDPRQRSTRMTAMTMSKVILFDFLVNCGATMLPQLGQRSEIKSSLDPENPQLLQ